MTFKVFLLLGLQGLCLAAPKLNLCADTTTIKPVDQVTLVCEELTYTVRILAPIGLTHLLTMIRPLLKFIL
jgi:hypothetical protein